MNNKTKHILRSGLVLLLCISMFIGSTFAWFTDSVQTKSNIIQAGTLGLEMYWTDDLENGEWHNVETSENKTIFNYEKWEPGYTQVRYIKLKNVGNLALNYKLAITPEGAVGKLAEVIQVYCAKNGEAIESFDDLEKMSAIGLLDTVLNGGETVDGTLLPATKNSPLNPSDEIVITLAMSMLTTAGNEYQEEDAGSFSITAVATQAAFEQDSYGANYDGSAEYPVILRPNFASTTVNNVDDKVAEAVTMVGEQVAATVPAGVALESGVQTLSLQVTPLEETTTDITVVDNEILIPIDVHVEGVAEDNTVPIIVELGEVLPKYLNMGNYLLYHVEDGVNVPMQLIDDAAEFTAHNQYKYNPLTGEVTVAMATFSEVALVANTENGWNGEYDYGWYDAGDKELEIANADQFAAFGRIVGGMAADEIVQDSFAGKTIKLLSDINLNHGTVLPDVTGTTKTIFYPIGYYNQMNGETSGYYERVAEVVGLEGVTSNVHAFSGTFDGNGHTIANIYQNTWEMFGDYNSGYTGTPNYYKDAMGLFGYVYGGTIKNLTVNNFSSDGEFTPTGVIAAYADGDATFENIAIVDCNPRVYNTGNGGIIGIAGDTSKVDDDHITLKNITVDNSNKISALWGSWDVACGGLVGMYRGNVDGSGNATGDTINFTNCHVAAQIDVYNDVCANYQYYAYRYAGMIIGSVRHNTTNTDGKTIPNMTGISATGCTVNYGTWNDYYYCEFEKNTMASYSEDYQFSRVDKSEIVFDANGNVTGCVHEHTAEEDKKAVYLPFHQLFTGYSWGVSSIGLKEYSGIVTDLGITEGDQEESVEKFESKFTGDFLYRVGNANPVTIGYLFGEKAERTEDEKAQNPIVDSGVFVTVKKVDENTNVSGTFTANTTDWTQGKIQFSGTGVVKVTIQDYQYCEPTVMYLEVVDATNVTTYSGLGNRNSVLLNDITMSSGSSYYLSGATLYGNGFTFDMTDGAYASGGNTSSSYVLGLNNANLDNVKIVGAVYTTYGATVKDAYNRAAVLSTGNNTITNSYISNCASAVRINSGNLEMVNTTIKGGNFANVDIRNGHVILDNVTTINQVNGNDTAEDGTVVIGLGVVVYYENVLSTTTVEVRNGITQYNHLSKEQASTYITDSTANTLVSAMFDANYSAVQYSDESDTWINTGILSMTETVGDENISDVDGYEEVSPSMTNVTGYLHTHVPDATSIVATPASYETAGQGSIAPSYEFDYASKNYMAKTDGSNDYCYEENGTVYISMDAGDSFAWDTSIFTATKNGQVLDYTVSMNGTDYTGKSITFTEAGKYEVVYAYTDHSNYEVEATNDITNITTYSKDYTKTVHISVAVIEAAAKQAEFTMGSSNVATEKITVDNVTYISATGVTADNSTWTYMTIGEEKIYYPIVAAKLTSTKGTSSYAYFPVFENVVTITDYADSGTGDAFTYNASTTTLPSTLTAVKGVYKAASDVTNWYDLTNSNLTQSGATKIFKWASSSDAPSDPETYNNVLCYKSPAISADRAKYITLVQYSYTDATNTTYYYYVGYTLEAFTKQPTCVTADTLVTLSDGTQKRIDQVGYSDELLVWDFDKGEYATAKASIIENHGYDYNDVIKLQFTDGTIVKAVNKHGFFDVDLNKWVDINPENAEAFIGHSFTQVNGKSYKTVKLTAVEIDKQYVEAWSVLTNDHYNCILEGMFSVTPPATEQLAFFDINSDMKYDADAKQADIEKYGLYTYEEFSELMTKEQFETFNIAEIKIAIGKGLITYEEVLALLASYAN